MRATEAQLEANYGNGEIVVRGTVKKGKTGRPMNEYQPHKYSKIQRDNQSRLQKIADSRNREVGTMNLTFNPRKIEHPADILKAPDTFKNKYSDRKYYRDKREFLSQG